MASSPLDKKFIEDVTKSLKFASDRQSNPCRYDKATSACYQRNSEHFSKCSHPIRFCKGDIAAFKTNTDRFLSNSLKIYKANKMISLLNGYAKSEHAEAMNQYNLLNQISKNTILFIFFC